MKDRDAFLLRADENSELLADAVFELIRKAHKLDGPVPDPVTLSHKDLRLLARACFKAGACFGMEEVIKLNRELH